MKIYVIRIRKNFYLTLAALLVIGLFWYTDFLTLIEIPVSGVSPYYHGNPSEAKISLTINVDWGEEYIPQILKILKEKDVNATFFITGRWASKFPDLVKRIYMDGHEIGNHGYSHLHPNRLSRKELIEHIKKNEEIIYGIIGVRTNLYAPPYGEYNKRVVTVADELGYKLIMWSADTIDWQRPAPQVIIDRVMRKASNGGIVLMHPIPQTVQALPIMINKLRAKGYELVTISELLKLVQPGEKDDSK
ncbi:polysaccharide deacetylase [Anoxybacter fermentans]|uniref:Polysaccharide deacetylase n=1 Tax=Anoxybacter fermentans TaxID=1323375 RepID=A0A3S9SVR4_9FIRM|nr:polysaccharide deacetylase family protein [Anoxybacter fermentans]AZR72407.1 polysaccharide deacetylase [Anoxybacter fermentans]